MGIVSFDVEIYIVCFYNNCVCFVVKRYDVCITMSVMLSRELLFICLCDLIASLHTKFNISGCFLCEIITIKADFNVSCVLLKDTHSVNSFDRRNDVCTLKYCINDTVKRYAMCTKSENHVCYAVKDMLCFVNKSACAILCVL